MTSCQKIIKIEIIENGIVVTTYGHLESKRNFTDIDELLEYIKVQIKVRRE